MKLGAHGHVVRSSLLVLWYKALLSVFTEERTTIASENDDIGSDGKEAETVGRQPVH